MALRNKFIVSVITLLVFCSTGSAQEGHFRFGARTSFGLSQVEGDNLRGFNHSSYEFALLGGYRFLDQSEFAVALNVEHLGSSRGGEDNPSNPGRYLASMDLDQMGLSLSYIRNINPDWDGTYKYRFMTGLKLNRILKSDVNVISGSVNDIYNIGEDDIRSQYISMHLGFGTHLSKNFTLDLNYEHGIQSILKDSEQNRFNKFLPFQLKLSLSYYLR